MFNFVFHAMAGTLVLNTNGSLEKSATSWDYVFLCHHPCLYCIQPCLHLVWMLFRIAIPTSLEMFCLKSISVDIFLVPYLLWRQTNPGSRCHRITRKNSTRFSRLWRKKSQKLTPDGENRSLGALAILSLVPRRKAISLVPRLMKGRESGDARVVWWRD